MNDALLDLGLQPLTADRPAGTDPIAARTYHHPALGNRPVIRLIGQAIAPAEDAAMAFFGFDAPSVGPELTAGRRRALGYPAWALVHDPANAEVALSVVAGMERTARLTAARPGFACGQYFQLAERLPAAHLPAFWEQAGRAYIAAGNGGQAADAFGRARAAELAHDLPVDEDVRREAYLEFAAGGGLTIKAIGEYLEDLRRRYPPDRAYEELVRLAERRTVAGFAPWAALPKQARTMAKAAGLDAAAEDARLLRLLIDLPATRHAPAGFWTAWRGALVKVARPAPDLLRRLLHLFPTGPDDGWWLELLDSAGAFDLLLASGEGEPAGWLTRMARERLRGRSWERKPPAKLCDLVSTLAGRLVADGVPVDLGRQGSAAGWDPDLDLLDACLAAGVPIVRPAPDQARLFLPQWLRSGGCRDLSALATDPELAPLLQDAVSRQLPFRGGEGARLGSVPALRPLVHQTLRTWAATARTGRLRAAAKALRDLDETLGPYLLPDYADLPAEFEAIDVPAILARTLRAGVYDEHGWPALDEAAQRLAGRDGIRHSVSRPVLALWNATTAVAVGPDGPVAEHDLRVPPGHEVEVLYSGGEFLVLHTPNPRDGWTGYWSSQPAAQFPLHLPWPLDTSHGVLNEAGERVNGSWVLRPGDQTVRSDRPGLEARDGTAGLSLVADECRVEVGKPTAGTPLVPPAPFWQAFEVRDPDGSAALRTISERTASALMSAVSHAGSDGAKLAAAVGRVLPEVTHPRLRLGIAALAQEALRLPARKHSLQSRMLMAPAARAVIQTDEPEGEDDVLEGLHGLVGHLPWYGELNDRPVAQLTVISKILDGAELTGGLPRSRGQWQALIGGAGAVAIRAAAAAFTPPVRKALLALLERWARTPFVREGVEVIVGAVESREPAVFRDSNGVCVALGRSGRLVGIRHTGKNPHIGVPVTELDVRSVGWGTAEQLGAFVRHARANGTLPWSREAADVLASESGLSSAAARLLLAGLPGLMAREHNFLDKDVRESLGLKVPEAAAGRNELAELPRPGLVALYGEAMPDDLANLADLWSPAGQVRYARRLAEAFCARFGRRTSVASETVAAAQQLDTITPAAQLLGMIAEPSNAAPLTRDGERLDALIADLALAVPWAYSHLPAGDPIRAGVPETLELIRRRLAHDGLLVHLGSLGSHADVMAEVSGLLGDPAGDDVVHVSYDDWAPEVRFRPARLPDDFEDGSVGRLLAVYALDSSGLPYAVRLLRGPGYQAMADRVRAGELPAGGYEADPELSAPDVLADVRAALGLGADADADAARLYLQLLALLEPTDRNVRLWNGWTPARHKQAVAVLVERGLVVEEKRARAGRSAFLPGGWVHTRAPNLPLERSKLDLYQLTLDDNGVVRGPLPRWQPLRPLPELFAEAWLRAQEKHDG